MKILVLVKVFGGEINPFDECALEEALRLSGEVTVISMAPPSAKEALLPLTRLGVREVILLSAPAFAGSDTLATTYILSRMIVRKEYDLILCGRQSVDGDTAQVGPGLAARLGIPVITNVMKLKCTKSTVSCETRGGKESAPFPALLTIERVNTLRFPSIRSRVGDITVIDNKTLGADPAKCGFHGSPTVVLETFENKSGKRKCKFISAKDFTALLPTLEPKTASPTPECPQKLATAVAVGEEVAGKARAIASEVILLPKTDPATLVKKIKQLSPGAVLFAADLWGRRYAPVVATLLETGLCADCTALETDGKELLMYRPARSGNIIAKIGCRCKPAMATVRIATPSDDVIIAGGKGVGDCFDLLRGFAASLGAGVCASRGAVDLGISPYETQVGLTGKTVSPRVYIAVGISGAIRHTCAIENAGTVIAINPDRSAPIFECADYGIVDTFEHFLSCK